MNIQIHNRAATELREEAASARSLSATFLDDRAIRDLLAYAAALDGAIASLDQAGFSAVHP
jgi:hypothetical protein